MNLKKVLGSKKILVVGDIILDHYVYGKVYRVSPEAPVPIVLKNKSTYCLGGSANVAQNISSFGSECFLLGVCGDDPASKYVESLLEIGSIKSLILKDPSRPTTEKTRIVGNGHQIVRVDNEKTNPVSSGIFEDIIKSFRKVVSGMDGVIIQDYGKGMLTKELIEEIITISGDFGIPILTDPKDKDFSKYSGSTWIKPNLFEFKEALGIPQQDEIDFGKYQELMDSLRNSFNFQNVLVTRSENGMIARTPDGFYNTPGFRIDVTDVSGAGDTVCAVFMLLLLSGVSYKDCLRLSNLAGYIVCQISGVVPINSDFFFSEVKRNKISIFDKNNNLISI